MSFTRGSVRDQCDPANFCRGQELGTGNRVLCTDGMPHDIYLCNIKVFQQLIQIVADVLSASAG